MSSTNNKREYWIDWLRISCSWLIVIYHANRLFDQKGTDLNMADSSLAQQLSISITQWHMPLFSVISGFSICLSLQSKNSIRSYFSERFHKLVIPFLASEIFLVLPNSYILARDYEESFISYFFVDFWRSHFAVYHLWWILYLLVISAINICLFQWLINVKTSFMNGEAIFGNNNGSFKYIFIQTNVVLIGCVITLQLSFPIALIWHILIVYGSLMYIPLIAIKTKNPRQNFSTTVFIAIIFFIGSRMAVVSYYPTLEIAQNSLYSIVTWGIHVVALNHFVLIGFFIKLFEAEISTVIAKFHFQKWLPVTVLFMAPFLTYFTPQNISSYDFDLRSYNSVFLAVGYELGQLLFIVILCLWSKNFCNSKLDPKWFEFLSHSAYPMYLSHNLWIYLIAKHIRYWEIDIFLKWIFVSFGAIGCCLVFFMVIRTTNVTRKMFGVPPKPVQKTDANTIN